MWVGSLDNLLKALFIKSNEGSITEIALKSLKLE